MENYLQRNKQFWEHGYYAPNVDHPIFRFYGRILKSEFNLDGSGGENLLDYGCGQGAAVNYFGQMGFSSYGVDISEADIEYAKNRYRHISQNFNTIDPVPAVDNMFFDQKYKIITAVQSLYYYSDTDLSIRMENLSSILDDNGIFYATMIGEACEAHYENAEPAMDGLSKIISGVARSGEGEHYMNFIKDEEELKHKFSMFQPIHIGFYSEKFRSDEGVSHHFTFVGKKK